VIRATYQGLEGKAFQFKIIIVDGLKVLEAYNLETGQDKGAIHKDRLRSQGSNFHLFP